MAVPIIHDIYVEQQSGGLGSAETLVAADAIRVVECSMSKIGERKRRRRSRNSSTQPYQRSIASDILRQLDWTIEFMEPGTVGDSSTMHHIDLIESCPVTVGDDSPGANQCLIAPTQNFVPGTTPQPISVLVTLPNLDQIQMDDCFSVITEISAEVGGPLLLQGMTQGIYAARAAHSLTGVTYTNETDAIAKFMGSSVAMSVVGGSSITLGCIKSFSLSTGMAIQPRKCASAASGYTASLVHYPDDCTLTFVIEKQAPGTTDWEALSRAETEVDLVIPFTDGTEIQIDSCTVGIVDDAEVDATACFSVELHPEGASWWKIETN